MQANEKNNIRKRLQKLLSQLKQIKQDINHLRSLQQSFTFVSILPQQFKQPKIRRTIPNNDEDKQNNPNQMNCIFEKNKQLDKMKQNKRSLILMPREIYDNNQQSFLSKNEQIKNIKAGLVMQLSQIKSMENKSQSMRRTNQKIKQYNSHQKRNYRQSLQKSKQKGNNNSYKNLQRTNILPSIKQSESLILDSKISIQIPIQVEQKTKILKCQKRHQYYEGQVNLLNQPHGTGRLQVCCSAISTSFGCQNVKDSQFYQGQFKDGKFHGFGTLSYKGGVKYVGQFKQGKRQGRGSMYCNGKAELATWENDNFISIM